MWGDNHWNRGRVRKGGWKTTEKENKQVTSSHLLIPETQMYVLIYYLYICVYAVFHYLFELKRESLTLGFLSKTGPKTSHALDLPYPCTESITHPQFLSHSANDQLSAFPLRVSSIQGSTLPASSVTPEVRLCICLNTAWPITTYQHMAGSKEGFYF